MKIVKKIKNQVAGVIGSFMLEFPTAKEPNLIKEKIEGEELDVSEEDQIKFAENAIEYNPESKKMMITYYQNYRDIPKDKYILNEFGNKVSIELGDRASIKNKIKDTWILDKFGHKVLVKNKKTK